MFCADACPHRTGSVCWSCERICGAHTRNRNPSALWTIYCQKQSTSMLLIWVLTFFVHMQFPCAIVYTWLFIFILIVQPVKMFYNSKRLQDNAQVLRLTHFQKQLCKSDQVNCLISVNVLRLWRNCWTVTLLQISPGGMGPHCAFATTLHVFSWFWRSVTPSTVPCLLWQVRNQEPLFYFYSIFFLLHSPLSDCPLVIEMLKALQIRVICVSVF